MDDDQQVLQEETPVEEAQIIEDDASGVEENSSVPKGVDELFTIQDSIKSRIGRLDQIKQNLKTQRDMLNSFLENEPEYREAAAAAKKASQLKTGVKNKLVKQPQAANLVETIKTLREEQSEISEALSYYLREYQRLTGANEFEGEDGELQQIVYIAKLVRKTNLGK